MRVFVYASVRLFGESLRASLNSHDFVTAVIAHHDAHDLAEHARSFEADVILFDITIRDQLPLVRALAIECPGTPVVALAVPEVVDDIIACAAAGFVSYVPRSASIPEMLKIVAMALHGEVLCDPSVVSSLWAEISRRSDPEELTRTVEQLTPRESDVMRLVGQGMSNKEIAHEIRLSVATVKNHVHSILRKLNLHRRTEVRQVLCDKPWLLHPLTPPESTPA